jgi:hypothetical protein
VILTDEKTAVMEQADFDRLLDYSCSIPTGYIEGKRWKRRRVYTDPSFGWLMGEYGVLDADGSCLIIWREILLCESEGGTK